MKNKLQLEFLAFGFLLSLTSFLFLLSQIITVRGYSEEIWTGILLDLLITLPIGYFLIIRKTKVPTFTTLYVLLFGLLVANWLLPSAQQILLTKINKVLIPLIELGILGVVVYKVRSLKKAFVTKQRQHLDFYDTLLLACQELFPKRIGSLLAAEISVFYYLFSTKKKLALKEAEYTYYKKSGIIMIVVVLLFLVLAETIVVHLLVAPYHFQIACLLTFLSLYAGLQIIAILRSLNRRPIKIDYTNQILRLRYGFACQTDIPFSHIKQIESSRKLLSTEKGNIKLSVFDLIDSHNVNLYLHQESTLQKIYGIQKSFSSISIFIDERDAFVAAIQEIISLPDTKVG